MTSVPLRRSAFVVPVVVLAGALATTSGAVAAPKPAPTYYGYGGYSYGSSVHVGSDVNSGRTSYLTMCSTRTGVHTDHAAAVDLGRVGTIGAVSTRTQGRQSGGTRTATSTSTTAGVDLLGGLVQAKTITSTATVTHTRTGFHRSGSSILVGLRIAGVPIAASVPENTIVELPLGLGRVMLNARSAGGRHGSYTSTTQAVQVSLNASAARGLGSGRVIIGTASANLHAPVHTRPYGTAYATRIDLANRTVSSGATAPVYLPCAGTSGTTITNRSAAVDLAGLVRTGAVADSGRSTDTSRATTATTSSRVAGVELLSGLITVRAIDTRATAVRTGRGLARSSAGTRIAGVMIAGRTIAVSGRENQRIGIPGVATVYLHRTIRSGSQIQVYGVQVTLLADGNGGRAGSTITIGSARAGVARR